MSERLAYLVAAHEPPVNELPAVIATPDLVSRGDRTAMAIPSLLVYSTGIELLIICRYRDGPPPSTEDRQEAARQATERARYTADQLPRLITVNMKAVEMLGGLHDRYGFTYRAWARFRPEQAGANLVFGLSWPGVPAATVSVNAARLADAIRRVVILWPRN